MNINKNLQKLFKQPKLTMGVPKGKYVVQEKRDGERMFLVDTGPSGYLLNRRGVNKIKKFPEMKPLFKKLKGKNIIDGEMVVFDKLGVDRFNLLVSRSHLKYNIKKNSQETPATFVAFDVLQKNGINVTNLSWKERNKILKSFPKSKRMISIISFPKKQAKRILKNKQVEGVVFKKVNSKYTPHKDDNWLKLKQKQDADLVVTGYQEGNGKRRGMVGSLYVGVLNKNKIQNVGKVGSFDGFSNSDLRKLKINLDKKKLNKEDKKIEVQPTTFVKVQYLKKGTQGRLREPKVIGVRDDISLQDTHTSKPTSLQDPKKIIHLAFQIKNKLKKFCYKIEIAGSIRRNKLPRDIDIVLIPRKKDKIRRELLKLGAKIVAEGESQIQSYIQNIKVDIYFATLETWGAQLMTRTGPVGGNIGNRTLAKKKGMLLNQYGLFRGKKRIAGRTERDIYQVLGKSYKKPELRG